MKKIIFILCLFVAAPSYAATLTWSAPTYSDNTVIPASIASQIVYSPYVGDTVSGPWVAGPKTAPGILSATLPDPAPGATKYYTVSGSLLGGPEGPKASPPASKTILKGIGSPSIISIQ